jgi:hypothetical protein
MKIAVYVIFWAVAFIVLLGIFSTSSEWQSIDFIYTAVFMMTLMISVGVNQIILRSFLRRGKYLAWIAFTLLNILAGSYFNDLLFDRLIDFVLPGYYFISYYTYFDLVKFFSAFVGLSILIGFSIEWFQLQRLEKEKLSAEFKALVNQVNPHFLFNGLNVVYTLSVKNSHETSSAIIKLSDILRYVIYQENSVTLASEVGVLRDYLDLQRYRVHPSTQVDLKVDISNEALTLAPMLFLPLVENAFKHGVHNETENAFIRMTLTELDHKINFMIVNNKSAHPHTTGIGLKNLRSRLQLLYPQKHSLLITETEHEFSVTMQINL